MSRKSWNNSNESGILIYNRVAKASSTTVLTYLNKSAQMNNFTFRVTYSDAIDHPNFPNITFSFGFLTWIVSVVSLSTKDCTKALR